MPQKNPVLEYLDAVGIFYTYHEHPPVYTCEEADTHMVDIIGGRVKNLFLRNRKGTRHYLVLVDSDMRVDIASIGEALGESGLGFGSPDRLMRYLGLETGSVSPFGLLNDAERAVQVVVHASLLAHDRLLFHPNTKTATIVVSTADFRRYLDTLGYPMTVWGDPM